MPIARATKRQEMKNSLCRNGAYRFTLESSKRRSTKKKTLEDSKALVSVHQHEDVHVGTPADTAPPRWTHARLFQLNGPDFYIRLSHAPYRVRGPSAAQTRHTVTDGVEERSIIWDAPVCPARTKSGRHRVLFTLASHRPARGISHGFSRTVSVEMPHTISWTQDGARDRWIRVPSWEDLQSTQPGKPRWLTPPSNAFCSTCFTPSTLKSC
jgi:hypothetical protein